MIHKGIFALGTALVVGLLDRFGKNWATANLELGERAPLVSDWISIARVESEAAAMGIFSSLPASAQSIALSLIAVSCLILVASFYHALTPREHGTAAALGAIFAGVASNAFDRFDRGRGIDFLHLGSSTSGLPDFNLADVAIVLGAVTLIVELLANEMASRAEERAER